MCAGIFVFPSPSLCCCVCHVYVCVCLSVPYCCREYPWTFWEGEDFASAVEKYVCRFACARASPSLFSDLEPLYELPGKVSCPQIAGLAPAPLFSFASLSVPNCFCGTVGIPQVSRATMYPGCTLYPGCYPCTMSVQCTMGVPGVVGVASGHLQANILDLVQRHLVQQTPCFLLFFSLPHVYHAFLPGGHLGSQRWLPIREAAAEKEKRLPGVSHYARQGCHCCGAGLSL